MNEKNLEFFRNSLKQARTLFDDETKEHNELQSRVYWLKDDLSKLRKTITALAAMCSEAPWADALGITDSCMEVMEVEKSEVSTQEIVRKLESMGFDLSSQKNPAASVHAILTRLAESAKIEKFTDEDGKVSWRGPGYDQEYADDDIPF
jgi:hypothetical protein